MGNCAGLLIIINKFKKEKDNTLDTLRKNEIGKAIHISSLLSNKFFRENLDRFQTNIREIEPKILLIQTLFRGYLSRTQGRIFMLKTE